MRLIKIILCSIFLGLIGCNNKTKNSLSFVTANDTIVINDFSLFENQNKSLFIGLNYEDVDKFSLRNATIKHLKIKLNNFEYIANPIGIIESTFDKNSDFVFPVETDFRKLILDTIDNKLIFTLASVNKNTEELKLKSNIKIIKFNSNEK